MIAACALGLKAQDEPQGGKAIYQSFLAGWGKTSSYDTYLSPLQYKGDNLSLMYERWKMTGLADGNISAQHLLNIEIAETDNPAKTATGYTGSLEYAYGMHYRFVFDNKFRVFAGVQADLFGGFNYNSRNGNNPATPKINVNLGLSGIALYQFKIKTQPIHLRYQLNLPFAGAMYANEYGQSYYEMDMNGYSGIVHFASFHNQLMMRNMLTVELPFRSAYMLRLSYMNNFYETRVNSLDTRIVSNTVLVGVSYSFRHISGRATSSESINSVFN